MGLISIHFTTDSTIAITEYTFSVLIFLFLSLRYQIWHCHKIGQGKLRVNIYIFIKELIPQTFQTKFQDNWPSGSWKDF